MNTAQLLKAYRLERQITQRQLAEAVGVDPITVSRWERGATTPSDLCRVKVARVLGVHPNSLLPVEVSS